MRDEKGDILFASTCGVHAWWPLEVAESKALLLAIKHAKSPRVMAMTISSWSLIVKFL